MIMLIELFKVPIGKADAIRYAKDLLSDRIEEKELIDIILSNQGVISSRASWVLEKAGKMNKEVILRNIQIICRNVENYDHNGTRRNILNATSCINLPESMHGIMFDKCCKILLKPDEVVAVKVHAMEIAGKIGLLYPDLRPELKGIILDQLARNTVAFRARAKKVLKKLKA